MHMATARPKEMTASVNREALPDFLRAFAIIGVLVIHSATRFSNGEIEQQIGAWFSAIMRPCIGIFLFISGYLLASKRLDAQTLRRRLRRVLVPYSIFAIGATVAAYRGLFLTEPFSPTTALEIAWRILIGDIFGIYYFVFLICYAYCFHYVTCLFNWDARVLLLLFTSSGLLQHAHGIDFWEVAFPLVSPEPVLMRSPAWLAYFYFGVAFRQSQWIDWTLHNKFAIFSMWTIAFGVYSLAVVLRITESHGYFSVIGNIYTVSTLLALTVIAKPSPAATSLSRNSYFLYLSHIFIVYGVRSMMRSAPIEPAFWMSVATFALSLTIPLATISLTRRYLGERVAGILGG